MDRHRLHAYRNWAADLTDIDLDEHPNAPAEYLVDSRFPVAMTIQHLTLELIHHGAEVSLLRALYRARRGHP